MDPWFFDHSEPQLSGRGNRLLKRPAGDMNLGLGHEQIPARLQAGVDLAEQPPLIRHLVNHHEGQGEVCLGIDRVSALEASETEWRRTEEALQGSEERFRLLVEAIPQPIWRSDADGNVIEFNRRWHEYTGQTAEEAKGSGWTKALHSDEAAMVVGKVRGGHNQWNSY